MLCPEYVGLEPIEQSIYIGKIVHAIQNDSEFYNKGLEMIVDATNKGVFDKVKFHPDSVIETNYPPKI